jgi:hypothetical protein
MSRILNTGKNSFTKIYKRFSDSFYIPTYCSTVGMVTATAEAAMRVTATATAGEERVTVTAMTRATTVTATGDTATARRVAIVRSCRYHLFLIFFLLPFLEMRLDINFTIVADPGSGAFVTPGSGIRDG